MNNLIMKLNGLFSGAVLHHTSLIAADGDLTNTLEATGFTRAVFDVVVNAIITFVLRAVYFICSFVLNIVELLQYVFCSLIGINNDIQDYKVIDTSNPLIKFLTNDTVLRVFRIVVGVAIVLIIVFTIYAIIKSEYNIAVENNADTNSKGRIMTRSLRSFFILGMFPIFMLAGIILVNAILAGFNDILSGGDSSTIAGQIFITSFHQANNYRKYAEEGQRVPIIVNFEDPISLGQDQAYSTDEMYEIYNNFNSRGKDLYASFADKTFDKFEQTITYRNNRIYNQASYSGFEKFVCTREQYYVMADFIDYAVKHNLKYYIKNIKDDDINWKYVSSEIYNREENSLTITYKDASDLNNNKEYTVVYAPTSEDISTPISDAIRTIQALLSVGDFSNNTFNILKRLENSINVVEWDIYQAKIKFSKQFRDTLKAIGGTLTTTNINRLIGSMTTTDQLILYELNKFEYNNTLNTTFDDLLSEQGFNLPVQKLQRRTYMANFQDFVVTEEYYVVKINNNYYEVEQNAVDDNGNPLRDEYGDRYYNIVESDFDLVKVGENENASTNSEDMVDFKFIYKSNQYNLGTFTQQVIEGVNSSFRDILQLPPRVDVEEYIGGQIAKYDDLLSDVIKQVSWPQKLINDLQVIYKDININQLITTNKWLTQLSEYVSATNKTENSQNITTALIHPLGLILSELFLGEIEYSDNFNLYGDLMFNSKFDEQTIKALMLSLMGEENYFQLKAQFEYFNEIYNVFMGPVLDEIAYYENFDLLNGAEASVQLFTYKAYLASMLISSSAADWFYNMAISLMGSVDFADDIVITNSASEDYGYYKQYKDLPERYRTSNELKSLYESLKGVLKAQGVEEGDTAYPEYLYALGDYIKDDSESFGGRLDAVLKSWKTTSRKTKEVNEIYLTLIDDYKNLCNAIENLSKSDNNIKASELLNMVIKADTTVSGVNDGSVLFSGDDEFSIAVHDYMIEALRARATEMKNDIKSYFSLRELSSSSQLDKCLDKYVDSIYEYAYAKLDYYQNDNSFNYNGKRGEYQATLNGYLNELKERFGCWIETITLSPLTEIKRYHKGEAYQTLYNIRQTLGISSYISSSDSDIFARELFEDAKSYKDWSALKERVYKIYDAVMNYTSEGVDDALANIEYNILWTKQRVGTEMANEIRDFVSKLKQIVDTQDIIDRLNRYYITYSVTAASTDTKSVTLDIVVNNKHYTVGQNFTSAKFLEYVLGAEYLNAKGYDTVFVDDDYKGFLAYTKTVDGIFNFGDYNADGSIKDRGEWSAASFSLLQDFIVQLGDISATLYQMTNFVNLSGNTYDEITMGVTEEGEEDIAQYLLETMIDSGYIADDLLVAFFDIKQGEVDSAGSIVQAAKNKVKINPTENTFERKKQNNEYLSTLLSYLLLSDPNKEHQNYVDYVKLTLKELRINALDFLVNYEKQEGESVEQNQNRYLAVLSLSCSDWAKVQPGRENDTAVVYTGAEANCWFKNTTYSKTVGNTTQFVTEPTRNFIRQLRVNNQGRAVIMRLAGLENRPYSELVGAEYTIDFNTKGVDEENGDIFIICTFDEEIRQYIPFMMATKRNADSYFEKDGTSVLNVGLAADEEGQTWLKYKFRNSFTEYYEEPEGSDTKAAFYPVIAKGIVTDGGLPTAIRENEGFIEFYRDDVVIHDVSETGLSMYYATLDQITVHHTGISSMINTFTEIFTGKSLVERLVEKIPRYAAHSNLNFCYGVARQDLDRLNNGYTLLNFNFSTSHGPKMESLYTLSDMNAIFLVIGTFSILMALWKALWGVIQRIYDITILFLLGPAVISTIPLRTDSKDSKGVINEGNDDMYSRWKSMLIEKIIGVFAYAIGFNIFFIVAPIISDMVLFTSNAAFVNIPIFGRVSINFINEFVRLIFLVGAATLSVKAPALFAKISGTKNGFEEGANTIKNVKSTVDSVKDVLSGQAAIDAVDDLKEQAGNLIPGVAIAKAVKKKAQQIATKVVAKGVEIYLRAKGIDKNTAKKASQALVNQVNAQMNQKEAYKAKRKAERDARNKARQGEKYTRPTEEIKEYNAATNALREANQQYQNDTLNTLAAAKSGSKSNREDRKNKRNAKKQARAARRAARRRRN